MWWGSNMLQQGLTLLGGTSTGKLVDVSNPTMGVSSSSPSTAIPATAIPATAMATAPASSLPGASSQFIVEDEALLGGRQAKRAKIEDADAALLAPVSAD